MLTNESLVQPQGSKKPFLEFLIEGKTYQSFEQYITGRFLKQLAGIPEDTDIFLSIAKPWKDELVENDGRVDLARPGIEYFYVKKKLQLSINGVGFTWFKQYISEEELRDLGNINHEDDLYLTIKPPFEDELISVGTIVNLARPGRENFISKPKAITQLIVNAKLKSWTQNTISFEQVIALAFGSYNWDSNRAYTIVYSNGPKENPKGIMVAGDVVKVKNETKFDVTATDKS